MWTLAGFCYVALLTDVYSRRILGWRVTTSKTTPLVLSTLEQALFVRRRADARFTATGVVHHSDAGSQYTSIAFTDALVDRHDRSWTGRAEVETETASWVHWYNTTRLHSSIGYQPPVEHEAAWAAGREQEQAA